MNNFVLKYFLAGLTLGNPMPSVPQNELDAEAILNNMKTTYEALHNFKIEYTQVLKDAENNTNQTVEGILYVEGEKFRVETVGQILISDNQKLWVYFEEENELKIDFVEDDENAFKPSDIFRLYQKDFLYTKIGTAKNKKTDERYYAIQFTPKDKDAYDIHTIKLFVSDKTFHIGEAHLKDKNNNTVIYKIEKQQGNLPLKPGLFNFDPAKYPGIFVTDNTK